MTTRPRTLYFASVSLLAAGLLWAYWPNLTEIAACWSSNPLYSHGYLVPLFSLFLLWQRRGLLEDAPIEPSWWGVPVGLGAMALHLVGTFFYIDQLSAGALPVALAGLSLACGGWACCRWSWPAVAFLVFMLPLPYRLEVALAGPLQRLATVASTYVLQTFGLPAVAEGNIIIMQEAKIGVEEACNGLGMLVTFFALTTAVALVLQRPLLDRLVIVLSALPIALLANLIRIVATGLAAEYAGPELADLIFHGLAGLLMMPLALALLGLELLVLSRLLVAPISDEEALAVHAFVAPAAGATAAAPAPARPGVPAMAAADAAHD